jgi:hypothetical protein
MAQQVLPIHGSAATVKVRDPLTSALLDAVTLGVYGFFWYFYVNRELAALGAARGTKELGESPRTSLLALLPGLLLIVPAAISLHNTARRTQAARRLAGEAPEISAMLAAVLLLFLFPVGIWYVQRELNAVWAAALAGTGGRSDRGPATATEPLPAEAPAHADA